MRPLVSVDTETTGLDPTRHEVWEVGIVSAIGAYWEFSAQFPLLRPEDADERALEIGNYHARRERDRIHPIAAKLNAQRIAELLDGVTLLGANPQFDAAFLARLLRDYGCEPTWHHRMLDLGSYAAGAMRATHPQGTQGLAESVVPNEDAHTALGDARWNVEVFHALRCERTP